MECIASGCDNTKKSVPEGRFFIIPRKDLERLERWLTFSGRHDLLCEDLSARKLYKDDSSEDQEWLRTPRFRRRRRKESNMCNCRKNCSTRRCPCCRAKKYVCSDHFSGLQYSSTLKTRLRKFAVPDIQPWNNEASMTPMQGAPVLEISSETPVLELSSETPIMPASPALMASSPKRKVTPRTQKIRYLRVKLSRERARSRIIRQLTYKKLRDEKIKFLRSEVPPLVYELVQRTYENNKLRRRKWSAQMKLQALNVYLQSPRAYSMLRKILNFPSKTTLLRVLKKYHVHVGFSEEAFQFLDVASRSLNTSERNCVLIWDEMAIKPNLTYNVHEDMVEGFVRYNSEFSDKVANEVLVFMVRGITKNYKQVLGYFFARGSTPFVLAEIVKSGVSKLKGINLIDCVSHSYVMKYHMYRL